MYTVRDKKVIKLHNHSIIKIIHKAGVYSLGMRLGSPM